MCFIYVQRFWFGPWEAKVRYEMEYFFENDDESSDSVRFMVFSGH